MDQTALTTQISTETETVQVNDTALNGANTLSNAVLKRLMEEVKYENQNNISAYNRTHNRHNRGR